MLTPIRALALGALLPAVLPVGACAPREFGEPVAISVPPRPDPYVGRSRQEIEKEWGRPARVETEVGGGSVLVYEETYDIRVKDRERKSLIVPPGQEQKVPGMDYSKPGVMRREIARFTLDASGVVVRTWFHASLWRRADGVPRPPKPKERRDPDPPE